MQNAVVVLAAFIAVAHGVNVELLKPYDVTASGMFHQEDTDGDGVFTRAELDADFAKYDLNGDGKESRHEYVTYICFLTPELYQLSHYLYDAYDSDGDHHLEEHDYTVLYAKMDSNGDGGVTESEWVAYWVALFTSLEGSGNHQHGHSHEHGANQCQ